MDQDKVHAEHPNSKKWETGMEAVDNSNESCLVQVLKLWADNHQIIIKRCNHKCMSIQEVEARRR